MRAGMLLCALLSAPRGTHAPGRSCAAELVEDEPVNTAEVLRAIMWLCKLVSTPS